MTTKEIAQYLNLNEKKIYALIKGGKIPCTKITGKWTFPRSLIDRWIEEDIQEPKALMADDIILTGSHDLSIDLLAMEMNRRYPGLILLSANLGSFQGLMALQQDRCHMAGAHLLHPETNEYNLPYLAEYLPNSKTVVISFVHRAQGFMIQPGNPLGITDFEDLDRSEVRFINRQDGAGTRLLLDFHLKRLGIAEDRIKGYDYQVSTHTEVASAIRGNRVDTGLGIHAAALAFGLDFIPVAMERFDFIIPRSVFYTESMQKLLGIIRSPDFIHKIEQLGGYDCHDTGQVLTWG